jgi:uncharacterized membrane protein YiaA
METLINNLVSKLTFFFITYIIISGGYIENTLPCQVQVFFKNNMFSKHIIGVLTSFLFIMLEGGWSFDMDEQDKYSVDWSNGNAIDSFIFGFGLYAIFLLTANMKLIPNLVFYTLLFIAYLLNTQRLYWKNRDNISEKNNEIILHINKFLLVFSLLVLIYGVFDYYLYKKLQFKKDFNIFKMIISNKVCNV